MTKKYQIYKCSLCSNIIEVLKEGDGDLVCCEENMILLEGKTEDEGKEKHVPIIEKTENGIKVKVGSNPHPMAESHFIEWIEVISGGKIYRRELKPGDKPEAEFNIPPGSIEAREYCNIHGLWKFSEE